MTIGIPKALLYYRYQYLWHTFFTQLGCQVVTSGSTCQTTLTQGVALSVGECCLPVKLFMGHVASLIGRCDLILVPRFETLDKNEEFCVRFWGLPDVVGNTFPHAPMLSYNLKGHRKSCQVREFLTMGKRLGKAPVQVLRAYRHAVQEQLRQDHLAQKRQASLLASPAPKVLLAGQPYLIHDAYTGAPLTRMIQQQGGVPVFADRFDPKACKAHSRAISKDLYWGVNKEIIGAIPLAKQQVDGVLLITAFPCGTDSLVNELVLRRIRDIPIAQIVLDEHQGEAGLQTRMECFMDILHERRGSRAR
ncbi:MAG: acyl-CoA dehydratase activase-related protein [Oscillospiraceae bacterium]|jgi:predicted nucleotide-binding protein (sugar kinase/HSP70/actin superfamily)